MFGLMAWRFAPASMLIVTVGPCALSPPGAQSDDMQSARQESRRMIRFNLISECCIQTQRFPLKRQVA